MRDVLEKEKHPLIAGLACFFTATSEIEEISAVGALITTTLPQKIGGVWMLPPYRPV